MFCFLVFHLLSEYFTVVVIMGPFWQTFVSSLGVYTQSSIEGTECPFEEQYDSDGAEMGLDSFVIQVNLPQSCIQLIILYFPSVFPDWDVLPYDDCLICDVLYWTFQMFEFLLTIVSHSKFAKVCTYYFNVSMTVRIDILLPQNQTKK